MSNPDSQLDIPQTPHARAAWVLYQLKLRGLSYAAVGRRIGCTRKAIAQAMRVPSFPQEQAIADALEVPIEQLFADRYDETGRRLHKVIAPRLKSSSRASRRNVKPGVAA